MNCKFLWVDHGDAMCDCASPKCGGQKNDNGMCDPKICELTLKQRKEE